MTGERQLRYERYSGERPGWPGRKQQTRKTAVEIAACDDSLAFVGRSVHDSGDLDATMSARHWTVSFEQ